MHSVPKPFDSVDHDVKTLATLIGHLPSILDIPFTDVRNEVNRARSDLRSARTVHEVLSALLANAPTGAITAITLERFQMQCPSNSEMFGCVTRDDRPTGPLSRSHYFIVMSTQSPTLDRSTGLECASRGASIHSSHDLWTLSAHEAWDNYGMLYGSDPGAAWLTVLLKRRRSHLYTSSRCRYCWTLNVDFFIAGHLVSTRDPRSTGGQLALYFARTRDEVELALTRLGLHAADHGLARLYDEHASTAGVIVRSGERIVAANRAAERVLGSWIAEPLTETSILRWLDDPHRNGDIRSEVPLSGGERAFVISREVSSITLADWPGHVAVAALPRQSPARIHICEQAELGNATVIDAVNEVRFRCLVLPFKNHIGVGIDSRGCHTITASEFQRLSIPALIQLFARSIDRPTIITNRPDPVALIIAEK